MGAHLSGCRAVPVEVDGKGQLILEELEPDDIERSLMLWVNYPVTQQGP